MSGHRVIQWGAGFVGTTALRHLLRDREHELVGLKCFTQEKEGVDAGTLAGTGPCGIRATTDAEDILGMDADCVLYMPRDPYLDPSVDGGPSRVWIEELVAILASGKNVVIPLTAGTHYRQLRNGERFRDELRAAAEKGGSTVLFTGFDPGFSDVLAFTMTGAVGAITRVDTWEIVDYGEYTVPETLKALGFSMRPEDLPGELMDEIRRTTWGGVPYAIADGLGVSIDRIELDSEDYLAPETFTAPGGLVVEEGTIAASRFSVRGVVGGAPFITVNHVTRFRWSVAAPASAGPTDRPSEGRPHERRVPQVRPVR